MGWHCHIYIFDLGSKRLQMQFGLMGVVLGSNLNCSHWRITVIICRGRPFASMDVPRESEILDKVFYQLKCLQCPKVSVSNPSMKSHVHISPGLKGVSPVFWKYWGVRFDHSDGALGFIFTPWAGQHISLQCQLMNRHMFSDYVFWRSQVEKVLKLYNYPKKILSTLCGKNRLIPIENQKAAALARSHTNSWSSSLERPTCRRPWRLAATERHLLTFCTKQG